MCGFFLLVRQVCVSAEPATSLQTQAMGPGGVGGVDPARSGGKQGALSGPAGPLSAEPSMRDLEGDFFLSNGRAAWLNQNLLLLIICASIGKMKGDESTQAFVGHFV